MRIGLYLPLPGTLLAVAALSLAGCADDGPSDPVGAGSTSSGAGGAGGDGAGGGGAGGAEEIPVTVQFEGRVGDEIFACGETYSGIGVGEVEVQFADFRMYLHDVHLRRTDGELVPVTLDQDGKWQYQNVVLLDFEDKSGRCSNGTEETNVAVRGTAPAGDYDGLSFKVGVPPELNHGDASAAPSPLNLSGLFWTWNDGYKFVRIDVVPAPATDGFLVHIGSTGCAKGEDGEVSCARPNVAEIALEGFDPLATKVLVDVEALVSTSDVGESSGCMSAPTEPGCAPLFEQIGLDPADGSPRPGQQAFFRVE